MRHPKINPRDYAKARRELGMTASQALRFARYKAKYSKHPLRGLGVGDKPVTLAIGSGLLARVRVVADNDSDLSYLGEFSNVPGPDAIKHDGGSREYKWFNPQLTGKEYAKEARQDYERAKSHGVNWYTVGVEVRVCYGALPGLLLADGALWGIESDSDPEYVAEVALDLIREAKPQALAELDAVRVKVCA